jgi:regulator of cell morphogenesis and NO signaling
MQPLRARLEDLARKARARMPSIARGVFERIESRVRRPSSAVSPPQPAAPAARVDAPPAASAPPKQINWELRSQAELVDHIEQHYHAGLRRDLPKLIDAARQVERDQHVFAGLTDLLESFAGDLESHMLKEERMLFPTLRTGARGGAIDMPMRMMEREHESHDEHLERIRELTRDFSAPTDAAPAVQQLCSGLAALDTDLRQHIYLENHVLFARASGGEY